MNRKQALKIAEELFVAELKRVAVDANLHDVYHADYPHAVKMAKRRQQLLKAMNVLFGDKSQLTMFEEEDI